MVRAGASPATIRPAGFVNVYATTNEVEDRASTFEYLIGQPSRLCEIAAHDPTVARKVGVVWKRVAKVMSEKLLRRYAPCVDWIDGRKPKPKPSKRRGPADLTLHD